VTLIDDQALEAYIRAAELRAKAEVCALYVVDYRSRFAPLYEIWRSTNHALLIRGEVVADERGMKGAKPPGIDGLARMQADLLAQLPADDRERRCEESLTELRVDRAS